MTRSNFKRLLDNHNLELSRAETNTLQINVGLACDLACRHCHLEAGPARTESMSIETMEAVIDCAKRLHFDTIDITGGAPELLPHLQRLINELAPLTPRLIVRTNLTALSLPESAGLPELYKKHKVAIVASLPATNPSQSESQRGCGIWDKCIDMLRRLNQLGYGIPGSGLELDLLSNPTGAFLPNGQLQTESRFRKELERKYLISFTNLFAVTNVPLGRFRTWLESSGNLDGYMQKLTDNFNPSTLPGLMCRTFISVDWNGYLNDCDFNLAAELPHNGQKLHISHLENLPESGIVIPVGDHCLACTAGSGFTCGGSIVDP